MLGLVGCALVLVQFGCDLMRHTLTHTHTHTLTHTHTHTTHTRTHAHTHTHTYHSLLLTSNRRLSSVSAAQTPAWLSVLHSKYFVMLIASFASYSVERK